VLTVPNLTTARKLSIAKTFSEFQPAREFSYTLDEDLEAPMEDVKYMFMRLEVGLELTMVGYLRRLC